MDPDGAREHESRLGFAKTGLPCLELVTAVGVCVHVLVSIILFLRGKILFPNSYGHTSPNPIQPSFVLKSPTFWTSPLTPSPPTNCLLGFIFDCLVCFCVVASVVLCFSWFVCVCSFSAVCQLKLWDPRRFVLVDVAAAALVESIAVCRSRHNACSAYVAEKAGRVDRRT